jgi:large subunit ribosomal protein L15
MTEKKTAKKAASKAGAKKVKKTTAKTEVKAERITLNNISAKHGARRRRKRVGCGLGSGHGKTSCRGQKGQNSRSGVSLSGFEGGQMPLMRRMPKRGFRNTMFATRYQIVSLDALTKKFQNQTEVTLDALRVHGLINGRKLVKVLGNGELKKGLKIQAHAFSQSALDKIKKAGGTADVIKVKKEAKAA